jgi:hypothetical protein
MSTNPRRGGSRVGTPRALHRSVVILLTLISGKFYDDRRDEYQTIAEQVNAHEPPARVAVFMLQILRLLDSQSAPGSCGVDDPYRYVERTFLDALNQQKTEVKECHESNARN